MMTTWYDDDSGRTSFSSTVYPYAVSDFFIFSNTSFGTVGTRCTSVVVKSYVSALPTSNWVNPSVFKRSRTTPPSPAVPDPLSICILNEDKSAGVCVAELVAVSRSVAIGVGEVVSLVAVCAGDSGDVVGL